MIFSLARAENGQKHYLALTDVPIFSRVASPVFGSDAVLSQLEPIGARRAFPCLYSSLLIPILGRLVWLFLFIFKFSVGIEVIRRTCLFFRLLFSVCFSLTPFLSPSDEPSLKARFTVWVEAPPSYGAISNMPQASLDPLPGGWQVLSFVLLVLFFSPSLCSFSQSGPLLPPSPSTSPPPKRAPSFGNESGGNGNYLRKKSELP